MSTCKAILVTLEPAKFSGLNTHLTLISVQLQNGLPFTTVNTVHKAASLFQALPNETDVGYCVTT